ncbi:MAG: hypothetical protein IH623_27905 [Verrucomicrobia bacterium]|nr:hypothetical protein [Verrucomicrobiota bacterium]
MADSPSNLSRALLPRLAGFVLLSAVLVACVSGAQKKPVVSTVGSQPQAAASIPANPANQRKALVLGSGNRLPGAGMTHPEGAKINFLKLAGNPANDPRKGWTCDLSWDLMHSLGMNPTNTPVEELFDYIGRHQLGYRIVINNGAGGYSMRFWGRALDNGMMPFAPQGNNTRGFRFDAAPGLHAAISVAGGSRDNVTSFGPSVELIDALPVWASHSNFEDAAQSWANQATATKFAKILDTHPHYNIWDARQHLRQAASFWDIGWNETNGFGRVNENAVVGKLRPGPPLEFRAVKSRNRRQVHFTWRNFLQSDFAATVIERDDGRILYEGTGTNFTWSCDVDGDATFRYWSKNRAGDSSRMESFQTRTVTGLNFRLNQTCLVIGAPPKEDGINSVLYSRFEQLATNWICDMVYRSGNPVYDQFTNFSTGPLVAVLPGVGAMVDYAISKDYRMILAPLTRSETNLFHYKTEWDRAAAAGILVVLPHHAMARFAQTMNTRMASPPRLFSAVTVGSSATNWPRTFGPGLEFVDATSARGFGLNDPALLEAVTIAGKLADILDANPRYNAWDARQHLRQSSSFYAEGWREDGGYGRPPETPAKLARLDPAPPMDLEVTRAADGRTVTFSWVNFRQSSFGETVIRRANGETIYQGTGTNLVWRSNVDGTETFSFHSRDKSGRLSRDESYTKFEVTGLVKN